MMVVYDSIYDGMVMVYDMNMYIYIHDSMVIIVMRRSRKKACSASENKANTDYRSRTFSLILFERPFICMKDTIPSVENREATPKRSICPFQWDVIKTRILKGGRQWYFSRPWISGKIAASAISIPPGLYQNNDQGMRLFRVYRYINILGSF